MPTVTIDPTEVLLGPGLLYAAPIGTTEPTDATTPLPSAWREIGYTDEGTTINMAYTSEGVPVAEEFYPIKYVTTNIEFSVEFAIKQFSRRNLALAMNAGANAANDATDIEPPAPGTDVRVMIVLQTEEDARWVFRQCYQGGTVAMQRNKAPAVAMMPVQFNMEKPTGLEPWIAFPTADGLV